MTEKERFLKHVRKTDGCWLWFGSVSNSGYGKTTVRRDGKLKHVGAHRAAWLIYNGDLPDGRICVCHRCDEKRCVNPSHLFLGTDKENVTDAYQKERRKRDGRPLYQPKFSPETVREIRNRAEVEGVTGRALAESYGVSRMLISKIINGQIYRYVS